MLSIDNNTVVIALVILAHAWSARLQGKPSVLSVIGWAINILALVVLAALFVRH